MARDVSPRFVSPSRLGMFSECSWKWQLRYLQEVKPPRQASRLLFGSVVHHARETWALDRKQQMEPLMRHAWAEQAKKDKPLRDFLREYDKLSLQARQLERDIALARPKLTHVKRSKDWKEHPLVLQINELVEDLAGSLTASAWEFTKTDPLPSLYDESLELAKTYSARWRHLPDALDTEIGFTVEWQGFTLTGKIDELMPVISPEGEVLGVGVIDAKTYKEAPFSPKVMDQGIIYRVALREMILSGQLDIDPKAEVFYGVDQMRLLSYRWWRITEKDERRLLSVLRSYEAGVENRVFLPAAQRCQAEMCDYKAECIFAYSPNDADDLNSMFNPEEDAPGDETSDPVPLIGSPHVMV